MRSLSSVIVAALILIGFTPIAVHADYLKNTDFKEGSQLWRGDGQAAFLNPDGTEGSEDDPGVTPVIKISLSQSRVHAISQEFDAKNPPGKFHFSVQVYASLDFKRSTRASDYQDDDYMPSTDFLVRLLPNYSEQSATLKPGRWVTMEGILFSGSETGEYEIYFIVPPGTGTIYIKKPSLASKG